MNKFARVMHPEEAKQIVQDRRIPTNRDGWGPHKQGSVVFLFLAEHTPSRYLWSRAEDLLEECGSAVIMLFEAILPYTPDESGWKGGGAVVYVGTIALGGLHNVRWLFYGKDLPTTPAVETQI
jgi:hypothetical protein